jgi:hypothetical protein
MEGKVFETIDLSKALEIELYKIVRLSKRATVFLSHASAALREAALQERMGKLIRQIV